MRLTLGEKYSYVIIGPRWMTIILMLLAMLSAFPCAMVDGWQFDMEPSVELSEGDSCRLRGGESGICRRIETCTAIINALDKKQIKYDSLVRCTFAGLSEVICCPNGNTGTNWGTNIPSPRPSRTTTQRTRITTTTTTTMRPIVIGDTVITGNEQFIDLSRAFGRTSSTTNGPSIRPNFGSNEERNGDPNFESNFRPNSGLNFPSNGGQQFGPNAGTNFRPGRGHNNNPNFGQNSGSNFRPGFGPNPNRNFGPNPQVNIRPDPRLNHESNFWPNQRQHSGRPANPWPQQPRGIGGQVRWPGQPSNHQDFPQQQQQQQPRPSNPDATWLSPVNNNNIQEPTSAQFIQSTTQSPPINQPNPSIAVFTDPFAPFQFRPDSNAPRPVVRSTVRTVSHNNLDDDDWSWQPTTTTTSTPRPQGSTAATVLDNWMLDALNSALSTSTTESTIQVPVTQTAPILDNWMVDALDNATRTTTPVPIIAIPLTPSTVTTTTQSVIPRTQNERPAEAACRTYRELDPAALTFHILDGIPVAPGDYPHMGGLIYAGTGSSNQVDLRCGSSLISERYVLTAAHCVNDPLLQPISVRFGVVVWNVTDEDNTPIDVDIETIILHPNYISPARYHDIALIRLVRNVEFSFAVRPACLHSNMADVDSSTKLVVIGWGITNIQTRARSDILLMTNVTTVPINECNATHVNLGVQRTLRNGLNLGQYCAYDPELRKDSCEADSGGPLQIVENKHSTIVGVVSFGVSCGSAVPSVYARVAFYLSWIESIVWPS